MKNLKYVGAFILMATFMVGGFSQLMTLNDTAVVYNAYLQMALGAVLFIWLCHKAIAATEVRIQKTPTNARDGKK